MQIRVNNETIHLDTQEVRFCREQVARIIKSVKEASRRRRRASYYFTFLIVMHVMSQNLLNEIDPKDLQMIMDAFNHRGEE